MTGSIFIDTNVLVYAYDRSDPQKQQQAFEVLEYLAFTGTGTVSTQVLAEFFTTVINKIAVPLTIPQAYERIQNYLQIWTVLDLSGMIVLEAARGVRDYQLSFWDAQIWAAARLNQIPVIFSEDFNSGSMIEGVQFINPFTDNFKIKDWFSGFKN